MFTIKFVLIVPIIIAYSSSLEYKCNDEGCSTCIDGSCTETCVGEACSICPLGNCCDGTNCNICQSEECCDTAQCNECVKKCSESCHSGSCNCMSRCLAGEGAENNEEIEEETAEVPEKQLSCKGAECSEVRCPNNRCSSRCYGYSCIQTSCSGNCERCPSGRCCNGSNCNICHRRSCCKTQVCNVCFKKCRSTCTKSRCYDSCYQNCLNPKKDTYKDGNIYVNVKPTEVKSVFNVTTSINITNFVNNTNVVESPIKLNETNVNNVNVALPNSPHNHHCCYVIHPPQCYYTPHGVQCFRRRHKECSGICSSSIIQIDPSPKPIPPNCYYIKQYPYIYCGQYSLQNCASCYLQQNQRYQCPSSCQQPYSGQMYASPMYPGPYAGQGAAPNAPTYPGQISVHNSPIHPGQMYMTLNSPAYYQGQQNQDTNTNFVQPPNDIDVRSANESKNDSKRTTEEVQN